MPEKISNSIDSSKFHDRDQRIWQVVLLLVVLVVVTVALVLACLYQFVDGSDCQISLYQGVIRADQSLSAILRGNAQKETAVVGSSTSQISPKQAKEFDFQVSDEENVWSTNTTIELFQTSYENDKGEVTVRSGENGKIVAPGTGGSYTFSLKNASKLDSNYQVWLEADMNVGSSGIPIEFRMSGTDGWIAGDDKNWLSARELNQAVERKNLYSGKVTEYTLYWRWQFERGEDEEDTSYGNVELNQGNISEGNMNVSQTISYQVTLHTLASEGLIEDGDNVPSVISPTPGGETNTDPVPDSDKEQGQDSEQEQDRNTDKNSDRNTDQNPEQSGIQANAHVISKEATKTADTTPLSKWLLLCSFTAVVAIVTGSRLFCRRKRKGR